MISTISDVNVMLSETKVYAGTIDLGQRQGATDYIDFLTQDDMKGDSVKRFVDKFSRPGFAFNLQTKKEIDIGRISGPIPAGYTAVLAIFQRYTDREKTSIGWGHSDQTMERVINTAHDMDILHRSCLMACDTCPIRGCCIRADVLLSILNGTHEFVGLTNAPETAR